MFFIDRLVLLRLSIEWQIPSYRSIVYHMDKEMCSSWVLEFSIDWIDSLIAHSRLKIINFDTSLLYCSFYVISASIAKLQPVKSFTTTIPTTGLEMGLWNFGMCSIQTWQCWVATQVEWEFRINWINWLWTIWMSPSDANTCRDVQRGCCVICCILWLHQNSFDAVCSLSFCKSGLCQILIIWRVVCVLKRTRRLWVVDDGYYSHFKKNGEWCR